jgi:YHS domain-containing protein
MKRINWTRRALFAAVTLTLFMGSAMAGSIINRANEGPAIEGYDTVAYHTKGQPQKGDAKYSTEWNGAKWQFATEENLQAFKVDPERYAPQYGGYCSYAMARNSFADGDPNRWKVVDGKLYLNANFFAQKLWERDIPEKIKSANTNWPGKKRELEAKP